jgi:hypothetical protein
MKKLQLKKLGDKALFQFNRRTKIIWEIQNKFKENGKWWATITATKSGITKCVSLDTVVWCKD